ncbi:MAG: hypothetical protein PHH00_03330 [Candidatus Nanoarchaeia archaeon]|nr:hypothetical protein [Candidatus Nanoarchaeia archaeon]
MTLFKKKKEEMRAVDEIPSLPELPRLPELPNLSSDNFQFKPNALPRFPPSTFGNKFSQNTIKDAVSGGKEVNEEFANESEEVQTMPKLPKGPLTRELDEEESFEEEMPRIPSRPLSDYRQKAEPMFVRLDKFEESLESFEKIKKQFAGVESLLEEIRRVREEEGKELGEWQSRLQTMKNQIDKIDRDIFSKIE